MSSRMAFVVYTLRPTCGARWREETMVGAAGTGRFVTKWYPSTVDHASVSPLAAWENFYVIVGSSAAALTGLQFVVVALLPDLRRGVQNAGEGIAIMEDWIWHIILPLLAYAALVAAAPAVVRDPLPALFVISAASVLLLFIGIHNAWDTVTYLVTDEQQKAEPD
jgi:hypothetical protein